MKKKCITNVGKTVEFNWIALKKKTADLLDAGKISPYDITRNDIIKWYVKMFTFKQSKGKYIVFRHGNARKIVDFR